MSWHTRSPPSRTEGGQGGGAEPRGLQMVYEGREAMKFGVGFVLTAQTYGWCSL
jgi:hypothetical protein